MFTKEYLDHAARCILLEKMPDGSEPDHAMLRKVEEELEVPEQAAWDFRRLVLAEIGAHFWIQTNPDRVLTAVLVRLAMKHAPQEQLKLCDKCYEANRPENREKK